MHELLLLSIEKNSSPYYIYINNSLNSKPKDIIQCELQSLKYISNAIANSGIKQINFNDGYMIFMEKKYIYEKSNFEFSFCGFYKSNNKGLKEQSEINKSMKKYISSFEEILSDTMFSDKIPNENLKIFEEILCSNQA